MKAGPAAETMEDQHLMETCQSVSATFLIHSRPTCLGMAFPTGHWVLPHQLIIMETVHGYAHSQPHGGNPSTAVPFSQVHQLDN